MGQEFFISDIKQWDECKQEREEREGEEKRKKKKKNESEKKKKKKNSIANKKCFCEGELLR